MTSKQGGPRPCRSMFGHILTVCYGCVDAMEMCHWCVKAFSVGLCKHVFNRFGFPPRLNRPLLLAVPPSLPFLCNVISPSPSISLTMSAVLVHPALCLSPPALWALQELLVFKGASQQYEMLFSLLHYMACFCCRKSMQTVATAEFTRSI